MQYNYCMMHYFVTDLFTVTVECTSTPLKFNPLLNRLTCPLERPTLEVNYVINNYKYSNKFDNTLFNHMSSRSVKIRNLLKHEHVINTYLLLAKCEVRTASYGPRGIFPILLWPKHEACRS